MSNEKMECDSMKDMDTRREYAIGNLREDMITLNTMSDRTKNTLDAWLKFGTVFLVYRLCSYYFFETDSNAVLFDKASVLMVLYILLGFTLYYMLVAPNLPINLQHPILKNIASDTVMFGTVLFTSHVIESYMGAGDYMNPDWLRNSGMILLAFAIYRIVINPFIPFEKFQPTTSPIVSDWAQFGTFLVALRLLNGGSVLDQKWIMSVLFALLGFAGYHLISKRFIVVN